MAIDPINVGLIANDGTGDDLREAFIKVNNNFDDVDVRLQTLTDVTGRNLVEGSGFNVFTEKQDNELLFRIYPGGQGNNASHSQLLFDFSNYLNDWTYVSLINNNDGNGNNTQKILINGEEVSSRTWSGEKDWSTGYVSTGIGGKYYDEPQTFKGSISSLEIWSTALSSEQIKSKMFYEFIGNESDLVSFWSFDEYNGLTVNDIGPSNNNGVLSTLLRSGDAPTPPVYGCTDSYALNYNPEATVDDGSCIDDPNTYHLSFDGESDFIHATNLDDYDGFMISGQPSSTFWHNDFSFTFDKT